MNDSTSTNVTYILHEWSDGDENAPARLMPLVYDELRRLAREYLQHERADHTLQPTALVHEAYIRLVDQSQVNWNNRAHFYGVAAQMMRRVLVDHARAHASEKRGGGQHKFSFDETILAPNERAAELVALDEALTALAEVVARKASVVELRFFGGLSVEETAQFLNVSDKTVKRDWQIAKLWLYRELNEGCAN